MRIFGEIEFEDGTKVGFNVASESAASWSRWGSSPRHVTAATDILDGISAALVEHAPDAEDEVAA
jgi:hypothetical protein